MSDALDFLQILDALGDWARADMRGMRTGGRPDAFDHVQLHSRPDPRGPEAQLTFRATLVDGRPGITVSRWPASGDVRRVLSSESATLTVVDTDDERDDGRAPDTPCEGCGTIGTVGRAVRIESDGTIMETHRFCEGCWPEQSARYRARWEDEDRRRHDAFFRHRDGFVAGGAGRGMWFQSATWHMTLDLVRQLTATLTAPVPISAEGLAQFAAQIRETAADRVGEMPYEVEMFLRQYGSSDA